VVGVVAVIGEHLNFNAVAAHVVALALSVVEKAVAVVDHLVAPFSHVISGLAAAAVAVVIVS
jgi:hypothetical protein